VVISDRSQIGTEGKKKNLKIEKPMQLPQAAVQSRQSHKRCQEERKMAKCGAKTEVYSRVVGYFRPVASWNKGKREEFKDRKTFDPVNCACLKKTDA
jgi:hypothetical protein